MSITLIKIPTISFSRMGCFRNERGKWYHQDLWKISIPLLLGGTILNPTISIKLRGKAIVPRDVLGFIEREKREYFYAPKGRRDPYRLVLGFPSEQGTAWLNKKLCGVHIYCKNRLTIMWMRFAYQRQNNSVGKTLFGVVSCDWLEPMHNKQGFNQHHITWNQFKTNMNKHFNLFWKQQTLYNAAKSWKQVESQGRRRKAQQAVQRRLRKSKRDLTDEQKAALYQEAFEEAQKEDSAVDAGLMPIEPIEYGDYVDGRLEDGTWFISEVISVAQAGIKIRYLGIRGHGSEVWITKSKRTDMMRLLGTMSGGAYFNPEVNPFEFENGPKAAMTDMLTRIISVTANRTSEKHDPDTLAQWFLEPVDPIALGLHDYNEIVKEPMDLGTIRANVESDKYIGAGCVDRFMYDVRLVFMNCALYNFQPAYLLQCNKILFQISEQWYRSFHAWLRASSSETSKEYVSETFVPAYLPDPVPMDERPSALKGVVIRLLMALEAAHVAK